MFGLAGILRCQVCLAELSMYLLCNQVRGDVAVCVLEFVQYVDGRFVEWLLCLILSLQVKQPASR